MIIHKKWNTFLKKSSFWGYKKDDINNHMGERVGERKSEVFEGGGRENPCHLLYSQHCSGFPKLSLLLLGLVYCAGEEEAKGNFLFPSLPRFSLFFFLQNPLSFFKLEPWFLVFFPWSCLHVAQENAFQRWAFLWVVFSFLVFFFSVWNNWMWFWKEWNDDCWE